MSRQLDSEEIIQSRLRGESVRAIAKRLGCTIEDVNDVLDRFASTTLTNKLRQHTLALELERLDALTNVFEPQTRAGDAQAGLLVVKIGERRATLLGLTPQPRALPQVNIEIKPIETSTERIKAAIDRIRGLPKPDPAPEDEPATAAEHDPKLHS